MRFLIIEVFMTGALALRAYCRNTVPVCMVSCRFAPAPGRGDSIPPGFRIGRRRLKTGYTMDRFRFQAAGRVAFLPDATSCALLANRRGRGRPGALNFRGRAS